MVEGWTWQDEDDGERERTLDEKVADVMRQLRRGEAKVVFDGKNGTVNIVVGRASRATRFR